VCIPPAAHTYQNDVETVHRIEEDEFFDLEDFSSRGDCLAKVHTYQLYFNLARPNSHKEHLSPWQIIERLAPRSPLELCLLPPVFLDYHLNDSGGYDVGRLPYRTYRSNAKRIAPFVISGLPIRPSPRSPFGCDGILNESVGMRDAVGCSTTYLLLSQRKRGILPVGNQNGGATLILL
jgi:hypothetical protein